MGNNVDPSAEYTCHYLNENREQVRRVYHVGHLDGIYQAMAMHNAANPECATTVIKWVSPEGTTFHMHDDKASI